MVTILHAKIAKFYFSYIDIKYHLLFHGITGVWIFFCLSGFLITHLLLKEKRYTLDISLKNFYVRRFLRLLPASWIYLFIIAILMTIPVIRTSKVSLIFSFLYLQNYLPQGQYYSTHLTHFWSLAVEEQFYLLWPPIVKIVNNHKVLLFFLILFSGPMSRLGSG